MVVQAVPVFVVNAITIWDQADECLRNKAMSTEFPAFSACIQFEPDIAGVAYAARDLELWETASPTFNPTDRTMIRDFVYSFVPNNAFPNDAIHINTSVSIDPCDGCGNWHGNQLSGATLAATVAF